MLNSLAELRARKAELEKQEQSLVKELRTRLKEQQDRLVKMGIRPEEPAAKAAPEVEIRPDAIEPPRVLQKK
jgi:hypothetical protein